MPSTELDQAITLEEGPKPARRPSTKEAAMRMLRELALIKDDETL